jgi:hypothetical protein
MMDLVATGPDQLHERIAGRFGRAEPRARVREYVSGLVTGLERKNGWTLAEWAGEVSPDGMQRLLRRADWDVDGVRDDVRAYVVEQLGEPDGVLIADDTGFLKKGTQGMPAAGQGRGRARPVPGPHLAGLACPHHLVHARAGLAGRQQGPGRKKGGAGTSDPGHDRRHVTGDPPPADRPGPGLRTRPRRRLVLVPLAPSSPGRCGSRW